MDFNTIYETIKPYLGTGAIASAIITVLALAVKVLGVIKDIKKTYANTENEALNAFKKAIPNELYVSIEKLAKDELNKILDKVKEVVDEQFLTQIKANTELTQAIANALITMKTIPDSAKKKIAELLEIKEVKTTESLKVELLTGETETKVLKKEEVLID